MMTPTEKIETLKKTVRLWLDNSDEAARASEPETKEYWMHSDRAMDMAHLLDILEA